MRPCRSWDPTSTRTAPSSCRAILRSTTPARALDGNTFGLTGGITAAAQCESDSHRHDGRLLVTAMAPWAEKSLRVPPSISPLGGTLIKNGPGNWLIDTSSNTIGSTVLNAGVLVLKIAAARPWAAATSRSTAAR